MAEPRVGVIGGSGLYELEGLSGARWEKVRTPFGEPSDAYCVGCLDGREVVFLPRHGRGHRLLPSELNYRANVYGMKALGVEWLISISAVGSMKEGIAPLDLVVVDQFYDHTRRRVSSFFGEGIGAHVGMADPVCPHLAGHVYRAALATGARVHPRGTYICIEGPQFSTKAESEIYRAWGVDVIGMTNMPEVKLAREAELCYATLALVTDYDVWHESEAAVSVEAVVANLLKNAATAKDVIRRVVPEIGSPRTCPCPHLLKDAIITPADAVPAATRKRLALLVGRYAPAPPRRARRRRSAAWKGAGRRG
jgi:5'-methylthioadenosine phosphorylase